MKRRGSGLVYSSDEGEMCPGCGHPVAACRCAGEATRSSTQGTVRVRRETKGRKGKGVTLVDGVVLEPADLAALTRELKRKCGTGGTIKSGVIEIQGDHRDALVDELTRRGYDVKRAGG